MDNQAKVREFHQAFGDEDLEYVDAALINLRRKLINEEAREADEALVGLSYGNYGYPAYSHLAKELADILVVVYGTADKFNIPLDDVFDLVHNSNMTKLDEDGNPIFREDGKILKGPNYVEPEPEIEKLLKEYWS